MARVENCKETFRPFPLRAEKETEREFYGDETKMEYSKTKTIKRISTETETKRKFRKNEYGNSAYTAKQLGPTCLSKC